MINNSLPSFALAIQAFHDIKSLNNYSRFLAFFHKIGEFIYILSTVFINIFDWKAIESNY